MNRAKIALVMLINMLVFPGCQHETPKHVSTKPIRYFELWIGYSHPVKFVNEISETEALSKFAYCIVYYNSVGQITAWTKVMDGKSLGLTEYVYYDNGKIKQVKFNNDGYATFLNFDEKGRPVK